MLYFYTADLNLQYSITIPKNKLLTVIMHSPLIITLNKYLTDINILKDDYLFTLTKIIYIFFINDF